MKSHVITGLVAALTAIAAMLLAEPDHMSQRAFPCVEDQVLGYAPQFGPDRVGCLNVEEVSK